MLTVEIKNGKVSNIDRILQGAKLIEWKAEGRNYAGFYKAIAWLPQEYCFCSDADSGTLCWGEVEVIRHLKSAYCEPHDEIRPTLHSQHRHGLTPRKSYG